MPELNAAVYDQRLVVKVTGIPAGTLQNWANRGIVKLSVQNPGRQRRRFYSPLDMMKILALFELTRVGLTTARAAEFADTIVLREAQRIAEEIARGSTSGGKAAMGNGCRATFFYQDGELQVNVANNVKAHMLNAIASGLRQSLVTIELNVSNIVYHVYMKILEESTENLHRDYPELDA